MKHNRLTLVTLASSALVASCSGTKESEASHHGHPSAESASQAHVGENGDEGEHVDLDQIPTPVRAAAMARLPTLVLVRAEREVEHGVLVYELIGTVNGEASELEISEFGNVLAVERAGRGEPDDHQGDDEDGDERDDG
jgi:hypothetical protein